MGKRSLFKAHCYGRLYAIAENWCLLKYCQLFKPGCEMFDTGRRKLEVYNINELKQWKIKRRAKKKILFRMIVGERKFNKAGVVMRIVEERFWKEGIFVPKEIAAVCIAFSKSIKGLIDVLTDDNITSDEYIQKTFMSKDETHREIEASVYEAVINEKRVPGVFVEYWIFSMYFEFVAAWCFCKYCQLFNSDCALFNPCMKELKGYLAGLKEWNLRGFANKRRKYRKWLIEYYDLDQEERLTSYLYSDYGEITDKAQQTAVCQAFIAGIKPLLRAVTDDRISIDTYLKETFALQNQTKNMKRILSLNQSMCLNEKSRINVYEYEKGEYNLSSDVYFVYVQGKADRCDFPHFHIMHRSDRWDIRMLPNGTFHSFKTKGKGMETMKDAARIEKITKQWVLQKNALTPDRTNGEVAKDCWARNNE